MPIVTATPKGLVNGEVVTEFTDVTGTASVTYTYPVQQAALSIENSGVADIFVTVGSYTNQVVKPDKKWRAVVSFTSFSVRSDANSQEFIATAFQNGEAGESATLGNELLDGSGWTAAGWAGSFSAGFTHTVGQTTPLTRTMTTTGTKLYLIEFTVTSPTPAGAPNASTDFTVSIGNSVPFVTYKGGGTFKYSFGIRSVSDGNLVFTPGSTFDGTISNISVKEILGAFAGALKIKGSANADSFEVRTTSTGLDNTYVGVNAGGYNVKGDGNVGVGKDALAKNTSGYWNTAIGKETLTDNTVGSRNVAVGRLALNNNISGDRNIAVGTFAMEGNTTGRQNIALGADTLWGNTTGNANIAIGMAVMSANTTGSNNIAIGYTALNSMADTSDNIAIGNEALKSATTSFGIAIGKWAARNAETANNTVVGFQALSKASTGISNTVLGYNGLAGNLTGSYNVAIGQSAGSGINGDYSIDGCVLIGTNAGWGLRTGANYNTFVGMEAGNSVTTGSNNILIGRQAQAPTATTSNHLNIGGAITGDLTTKNITLKGGLNLASIPTTNPNIAGQVWNNAGVLSVSAG